MPLGLHSLSPSRFGLGRGLPGPRRFRIGQEAVANAVKHSGGSSVQITLAVAAGTVRLSVTDDGRGFRPEAAPSAPLGHFGLLGMRQRASRIGAKFGLESEPGYGTTVTVTVKGAASPKSMV